MFIYVLVNKEDPGDTPLVVVADTFLHMVEKVKNSGDITVDSWEMQQAPLEKGVVIERGTDIIGIVTEKRSTSANGLGEENIFNVFAYSIDLKANVLPA